MLMVFFTYLITKTTYFILLHFYSYFAINSILRMFVPVLYSMS